jgi:hypothetical protein
MMHQGERRILGQELIADPFEGTKLRYIINEPVEEVSIDGLGAQEGKPSGTEVIEVSEGE